MRRENEYQSKLSKSDMLLRALWTICCTLFFKPFPSKVFRPWRNIVLRAFGAKIHQRAGVYSSAKIYEPWHLVMDDNAWIGPNTIIYNVDQICLGKNVTVSQYAYLCTASHDFNKKSFDLITAPIRIEDNAWIAADAFVGMGLKIGVGAVIAARASVYRDVEPWTVVGGNPAKVISKREVK